MSMDTLKSRRQKPSPPKLNKPLPRLLVTIFLLAGCGAVSLNCLALENVAAGDAKSAGNTQYAAAFPGATADRKVAAAIAAFEGHAGVVDARGLTGAQTWESPLTIVSPVTIWLPCLTITANAQMFDIRTSGVHIFGCGLGVGPFTTLGSPQTKIVARLGRATDLIVVQSTNRSTLTSARLADFKIRDVYIDMQSTGRRAIYTTSCWDCEVSYVEAINLNGDAGLYIQGDLASDGTLGAASYQYKLDHVFMEPVQNNTTTHPFYFDASNGEVSYIVATFLRGDGPCCNGVFGGRDAFYVTTGTNVIDSFDQNSFDNIHGGNGTAGAYGFKIVTQGNFQAGTGGRVFNIFLNNAQFERINLPTSGTGIGCVDGTNTPNGAGCAAITANLLTAGNFTTGIDFSHMGESFSCIGCNNGPQLGSFLSAGDYYAQGLTLGAFDFFGNLHATGAPQDVPASFIHPGSCDFASQNNSHCEGLFIDFSGTNLENLGKGNTVTALLIKPFAGNGNPSNANGLWITGNPRAGSESRFGFRNDGTSYFGSIFNDAAGFKHKRGVPGCTTPARAGSLCTTTVAWTTAFADANYTVTCSGNGVAKGVPLYAGTDNKSAASVEVMTVNATGVAASFSDIECIAVHD